MSELASIRNVQIQGHDKNAYFPKCAHRLFSAITTGAKALCTAMRSANADVGSNTSWFACHQRQACKANDLVHVVAKHVKTMFWKLVQVWDTVKHP